MNSSWNMMGLLKYSLELYNDLEAETGQAVDFRETGSLRIAVNQDRMDEFEHRKGIAATLEAVKNVDTRKISSDLAEVFRRLAGGQELVLTRQLSSCLRIETLQRSTLRDQMSGAGGSALISK